MKGGDDTVVLSRESGFSLIEVVIAMVILMTLLVSVASLLATTFKVGANSRFRQAATEIATSTLDSQVQQGSTTLVTDVGDTSLPSVISAGQTYVVEMEISPYQSSNASACASPNGGLAMLKITVWVTWANVTTGLNWWVSGSSHSTGLLVEETTLLSLPSTAFNGNDGSVLVAITGATGSADGIQSVSVTATSGSTTYTDSTTSSGCVLFANLAPGTWTIGASEAGYIDAFNDWNTSTNSALPLSGSATVVAGNVTSLSFTYDQEATVTPGYSAPADGGELTPNPTGISTMPLTYYTSYGTGYPSTGVILPSPSSVFPSNTSPSYYVVAGSCGIESAPDGNNITGAQTDGQPITVAPGGTANPAFALTPLELVVTHSGTPVANATVTATSTDSNCATGSLAMPTLGLGTTCNPTGPTYPCTYQLAAHRIFHGKTHPAYILVTSNTSMTLGTSSASVPYGAPVQFTAQVTRTSGSGTPSGNVVFKAGGTTITGCSAVAVSGSGSTASASCTTSSLAVTGGIAITASFSSSTGFGTSSATLSPNQIVTTAPATAVLTWSPIPSAYGNTVLLTATVTANSPSTATPTGTVTFQQGGTNISGCVNVAVTSGAATCSVSGLAGGSYTMKATYTASGNFSGPSSSSLTQSVTAASTTTAVTSSVNPSTYGQSVTLTATLTSATGAAPVGKVNFTNAGTTIGSCGTVTVTAGVATCTTTSLPVGPQSIAATFTPTTSTNFAASTGTLTQQVNLAVSTPYLLVGMPVGVWTVKIVYGASTSTFSLTITPGESALLLQEAD